MAKNNSDRALPCENNVQKNVGSRTRIVNVHSLTPCFVSQRLHTVMLHGEIDRVNEVRTDGVSHVIRSTCDDVIHEFIGHGCANKSDRTHAVGDVTLPHEFFRAQYRKYRVGILLFLFRETGQLSDMFPSCGLPTVTMFSPSSGIILPTTAEHGNKLFCPIIVNFYQQKDWHLSLVCSRSSALTAWVVYRMLV